MLMFTLHDLLIAIIVALELLLEYIAQHKKDNRPSSQLGGYLIDKK